MQLLFFLGISQNTSHPIPPHPPKSYPCSSHRCCIFLVRKTHLIPPHPIPPHPPKSYPCSSHRCCVLLFLHGGNTAITNIKLISYTHSAKCRKSGELVQTQGRTHARRDARTHAQNASQHPINKSIARSPPSMEHGKYVSYSINASQTQSNDLLPQWNKANVDRTVSCHKNTQRTTLRSTQQTLYNKHTGHKTNPNPMPSII